MEKSTYIDIFAGCGGLSLGLFNSSKWKGIFAIEKSPDAFNTLEHNLIHNKNHFDWPSWLPQTSHDIKEVLKKYNNELISLRGKIDLVAGGPPCQGFSPAGTRNEADSRNKLIKSYIKFIRLIQPKVIFFENVKGFTQKFKKNKTKGIAYSDYVLNVLKCNRKDYIGYDVYGELVDFSKFGIPQKRTRFILVGIRKDLILNVRANVFFKNICENKESFLINKNLDTSVTLYDAISDLLQANNQIGSPDSKGFKAGAYGKISSKYQEYIRSDIKAINPDSHRFAKHRKKTVERFNFILNNASKNKTLCSEIKNKYGIKKHTVIPLDESEPAATLTTLPDDYIHYSEPRIFTVREYARIQSFNDWFEFKGKYTTGGKLRIKEVPRYSQIGNAIPPLFGEQAGIALKKILENG